MQSNIKKYTNILETSRTPKAVFFVINKMIPNHLTESLNTLHILQYA